MYEKLVTAPTTEPVTVEEQCKFSRIAVPGTDDGGSPPGPNLERLLIQACITTAREHVEQITKTSMISQRWLLSFDTFPGQEDRYQFGTLQSALLPGVYFPYTQYKFPSEDSIELLRRPVINTGDDLVVVTYLDANGAEQTLDSSNYVVFADRITLLPGKSWPVTASMRDAVRVEYSSGYGDDATAVPAKLLTATKYLAGHFYDVRNPVSTEVTQEVAMTLSILMGQFRLFRIPR